MNNNKKYNNMNKYNSIDDIIKSMPDDINSYYIIQDEQYRPNRAEFVFEEFKLAYPNINANSAEKVYAICARSKVLTEWLAIINLKYASIQNEPTFYRDIINAEDYNEVMKDFTRISIVNRSEANELLLASNKYQKDVEAIKTKYAKQRKTNNSFSRVIGMNSTELPLTIQLAIENYTPAGAEKTVPTKNEYAREMLIRYKTFLINKLKEDTSISVDDLIKENAVL